MKKNNPQVDPNIVPGYELTNAFLSPSQLKERLRMLTTAPTQKRAMWRYALIVPVVALPMLYLAACDRKEKDLVGSGRKAVVETPANEPAIIKGKVVGPDGKPLPGAMIELVGLQSGTSTDADGNFVFRLPKRQVKSQLEVSFQGFPSRRITVQRSGMFIISLGNDAAVVEESLPVTDKTEQKGTLTVIETRKDVFTVVEHQPEFVGGMKALSAYVNDNLNYPEAAKRAGVEGKVFLSFVVDKEGGIHDVNVLKGLGFGCDEAAIRLVSRMPAWKPGRQDGKSVAVRYNIPIQFTLK
nr:TonB family protein [uncultured Arsenicibacter sp.]